MDDGGFLISASADGFSSAGDTTAGAEQLTEANQLAAQEMSGCTSCGNRASGLYLEAAEQGNIEAGIRWADRCLRGGSGFLGGCEASKALSFFEMGAVQEPSVGLRLFACVKAGEGNAKGIGGSANMTRGCEFFKNGLGILKSVLARLELHGAEGDKAAGELVGHIGTIASLYFNHGGCVYRGNHQKLGSPLDRALGRFWAVRAGLIAPPGMLPDLSAVLGPRGEPSYIGTIMWEGGSTLPAIYAEPWMMYIWLGEKEGQWAAYCKELGFIGVESIKVHWGTKQLTLSSVDGNTVLIGSYIEGAAMSSQLQARISQTGGQIGAGRLQLPEQLSADIMTDHEAIAKKRGTGLRLQNGSEFPLLKPRILEQSCNLKTKEDCTAEHIQAHTVFGALAPSDLHALRADLYEDAHQGCPASPKLAKLCTWDSWQAQHRLFVLEHMLSEVETRNHMKGGL